VAGLSGYLSEYGSEDDHHVGRVEIRLDTSVNDNTVTVTGSFGVRDWSGDWDDDYDGVIDFVVLAELESATEPPPRADLLITGIEFNQATQFFRAGSYLDPANALPDNSIFLIAAKNTGVRVFVDWDASAGLPPIAQLGGELIVSNATATVTLSPINPGGSIVPKRDSAINQALANDTLNFMIPAAFCAGTVTVTCRVFDQASTSARSGAFTRTLLFVPVEPLNLFLVGVTTQAPAAPAPTQAAVAGALSLLKQTYPRGLVQVTGFTTATLAAQIAGLMTSSGCGQGWSDLLDILRDLKGDSDDVYFGGLPAGISANGVIGCSPVGERLAASFIDLLPTVPHEVGHSLGRNHAPCRGCSPPAQDPDENFPQYNTFNSDSIGVFGFDPTTNSVLNPASTLDFMTAFLPASAWVSPYTYRGLLGPIQAPSASGGLTYLRGLRMTLFLRLEISRGRDVRRECSFAYPAPPQGGGCNTAFEYELLDGDGQLLDCGPLHCPCNESACGCWPKRIRDAIPLPEGARWFVVREGDEEIYKEEIPDPPAVRLTRAESKTDGIHLRWESDAGEAGCYLVQVRDSAGVYRGLAPRSRQKSHVIPRRLFTDGPTLRVRILASSGIATGMAEEDVEIEDYESPEITLELVEVENREDEPDVIPAVVSVLAVDAAGRELAPDQITWYDGNGNQLAKGPQVDLRALPAGRAVVRAVARGHGRRTAAMGWVVERGDKGFTLHAHMPDPPRRRRETAHKHPHPKPSRNPKKSGG
jgi:hypothetical protein